MIKITYEQGYPGFDPIIVRILTNATLATVTTDGWLNGPASEGYILPPTAKYLVSYNGGCNFFNVTLSNGIYTLATAPTGIVLPVTSGDLPVFSGTTGLMADSGLVAAKTPQYIFPSNDSALDLVYFNTTISFDTLASGGHVGLYLATVGATYNIVNIWLNKRGTNFSGGGGDRLLQITDGVNVFSLVPAANLQTLVNASWGQTALPFPATAAIDFPTATGTALYAAYSDGTTDYTAGSTVISGIMMRIS